MGEDSGLGRGSPGNLRPAQPRILTFTMANGQWLQAAWTSHCLSLELWSLEGRRKGCEGWNLEFLLVLPPWVGAKKGQDRETFASIRGNSKLFLNVWGLHGIRAILCTLREVGERKSCGKNRTGVLEKRGLCDSCQISFVWALLFLNL